MNLIQLITAFGLGAIITALIQSWLSHKAAISKRNFEEKKECYAGFLDAIHKSDFQQTTENSFYLSHWINRIELIGSKEVRYLCQRFLETNPVNGEVHPQRREVFSELKKNYAKRPGCHPLI